MKSSPWDTGKLNILYTEGPSIQDSLDPRYPQQPKTGHSKISFVLKDLGRKLSTLRS